MKKAFLAVAVGSMLLVGCTTTNQAVLGTQNLKFNSEASRVEPTTQQTKSWCYVQLFQQCKTWDLLLTKPMRR